MFRASKGHPGTGFLAHVEKLHALAVVRDAGGLRAAAAQLGIAPSSLSEKLGALEALYGRALVERGREGLRLTPFALDLVAQATPAMDGLVALAPDASKPARVERIRIGAYDSLAVHVLPRLVANLADRNTGLRLDVSTGRSAVLLTALGRGELDFAIVIADEPRPALEMKRVATESLCFAVDSDERETTARAQVLAGRYIGLSPRRSYPPYYRAFVSAFGASLAPLLTCDSFEVAASLARSMKIPALLPRRVASRVGGLRVLHAASEAELASQHDVVLVRRRTFKSANFALLYEGLVRSLGSRT